MTSVIIVAAAAALIGLYVAMAYNSMVRLRLKVDEAWSDIDVQLQRRFDLVPNLVEAVKGYAAHEKSIMENLAQARSAVQSARQAGGVQILGAAEAGLTQALGGMFAVAEAYPELQASQNFLELQQQLGSLEQDISASRRIYNGNVQAYNTRIQMVPANLLAGAFGFQAREFFQLRDSQAREPVPVDLG